MPPTPSHRDSDRHPSARPELGVGITFSSAIEPLLDRHADLIDVVEVEPQTTWLDVPSSSGRYRRLDDVASFIRDLPFRKLVHSIGVPVGGTATHDPDQVALLRDTIEELGSPWASEHLSFNRTDDVPHRILPAATSDRRWCRGRQPIRFGDSRPASEFRCAFETGVNYLARRPDEMDDGAFVAAVAERADSGILLDLHNVYTNEVNGRQTVDDFVAQLPLERVWEVHLAGGFWMDGYWLDAHSGPMPASLHDQAKEIVSRLPNLGAIIFEIYPAFVESAGFDEICRQLELLRELWSLRGSRVEARTSRAGGGRLVAVER